MKFNGRLRELREEKKLFQKDLAEILGVKRSTVAGWESGNRKPDLEVLIQISNYFKCSIDYLAGKTDIKEPKNAYDITLDAEGGARIVLNL